MIVMFKANRKLSLLMQQKNTPIATDIIHNISTTLDVMKVILL